VLHRHSVFGRRSGDLAQLKLNRESLSQGVVEHRIAGLVGELGEHGFTEFVPSAPLPSLALEPWAP
jgi:hypothetical protein